MSTPRTLTWWESPRDLSILTETRYNLNISFAVRNISEVNSRNAPEANVVFRSLAATSRAQIQWQPKYALSFIQDLPPLDSIVHLHAPWQPCRKGWSYDLGASGFFQEMLTFGPPESRDTLLVVNKYPAALHFVVGIYSDDAQQYQPIFVDTRRTGLGEVAAYRPTENVQWWLDRPLVSGSFFDAGRNLGSVGSWTFKKPGLKDSSSGILTTFNMADGEWVVRNGSLPPDGSHGELCDSEIAQTSRRDA